MHFDAIRRKDNALLQWHSAVVKPSAGRDQASF